MQGLWGNGADGQHDHFHWQWATDTAMPVPRPGTTVVVEFIEGHINPLLEFAHYGWDDIDSCLSRDVVGVYM